MMGFVFPRHVADAMIKKASGDARKLEKLLLGLDPGSLGDSPKMVNCHKFIIMTEMKKVHVNQWRQEENISRRFEAVIDKVPIDKLDP